MAIQTGSVAYLKVKNLADSIYTKVGKADGLTLNLNTAEIEAGHMDDGGWTEYLQGKSDGTIDFSLLYDEADAGQGILLSNYFAKTAFDAKYAMRTGTGSKEYTCQAFVTSLVQDGPDGDKAALTGTLRITTKPTSGVQA